ncbi:GNAT family N-acetyltransferase [Marinicauda salina]|uniref:GNAT family N-acetyltransferase n=1 Tax=Marinicauda salina TaxID=2135793 RepID=A0A2U2BS33_9PROT|nr:GNAT family N-acetyltransferase [Marinicauda salina]PWE16809.1 GNAT family N-acetyltransferase [Marinicauda salina]
MASSARADAPVLRPARSDERDALDALILRSKAWWGYDAAMMAVMARWLRADPDAIEDGRCRVAEAGEQRLGVAQLGRLENGAVELELLFIDPAAIGSGVGRALYDWAREAARRAGATRMTILADPQSRGFYEAMGARFVEDRPSQAVPGRTLPWLEHPLG